MDDNKKSVGEVFTQMAGLCSRTEQCTPDIRKRITTAGLSEAEADEIIDKLTTENFIDDERFIRSYISDKFRLNKWGKVKIRHYLKMKGLSDGLIQNELDKIDEEKYRETLIKTLKEKARTIKKENKFEKMAQIIRFAQNRGFEPEWIHRYLDEVIE